MADFKRVFLIVLDSFGIGEAPDADKFNDVGSNTLGTCFKSGKLYVPAMQSLGLFNINGVDCGQSISSPIGAYGKMTEMSMGKDTTIGHWEISGVVSPKPLPTYKDGFPEDIIKEFEKQTGRKVLCNKPYSGTAVINDYGEEHIKTGGLIVYTSADSVFQIAAHEDVVPVEKLYEYCKIARDILTGENAVGRVIARPFVGSKGNFTRTTNRHDFSLVPPKKTVLDYISGAGLDVIGVGKINDIFAGQGITEFVRTTSNDDGMNKTFGYVSKDFNGLCFINLVDFDMLYGHRNDVAGYTLALNKFDEQLTKLMTMLYDDDILIITADHGCDPGTASTDHSREYTPMLAWTRNIRGANIGIRKSFADIGATVADLLGVKAECDGISFKNLLF